MASPVMRWYLPDDSAESGVLSFTPTAGSPTVGVQRNLWNDKGSVAGSENANEVRLVAKARDDGSSGPYETDHDVLVAGGVEFRLTGSSGTGIESQTTAWSPLGPGRDGFLKSIPANCKRLVEFRFNVAAGYGSEDVEVIVDVHVADPATLLTDGFAPAGASGVCHGVGDGDFSFLLEGGVATANGSPDNKVDFTTLTWIHKGVPKCKLVHEVTFSNLDVNSEALTSGQTYWATVSVGSSSSALTVTKSARAAGPQSASNRPAVPDGEILVAYVEVEFDATIEQADIYQSSVTYGWFKYSAAGLVVTIQPGWALCDVRLIRLTKTNNLTLTNSTTNYVWLNPRGTFTANTTGVAPFSRSILLYVMTTAGGAVTVVVDRRQFVGKSTLDLQFDAAGVIVDEQKVYRALPGHGRLYVLPLYGVAVTVGEDGTVSGQTKVDIETSDAGGAWTTIFTSFGTTDLRPSVAWDSTTKRSDSARPEVFELPVSGRVRARVDTIPGGSDSADLSVLVRAVLA